MKLNNLKRNGATIHKMYGEDTEVKKAYRNGQLIWQYLATSALTPTPQITGISFQSLSWQTDISWSGGTANKNNTAYSIYAHKDNGTMVDITAAANVSGELIIASSTTDTRHECGTLTLSATYKTFSATSSVTAYQEAMPVPQLTGISFSAFTWNTDVPASGGDATYQNCSFYINGYYTNGTTKDITSACTYTGSLSAESASTPIRQLVGTLSFSATCSGITEGASVNAYQKGRTVETYTTYVSSSATQTVSFTDMTNLWYSYDRNTWSAVTGTLTFGTGYGTGGAIYVAGNNTTRGHISFGTSTSKTQIAGTINGLFDCFNADTSNFSFSANGMYSANTAIVHCAYAYLPATTLAPYCYPGLFKQCTKLDNVSYLPAANVPFQAYASMYYGCTSLTSLKDVSGNHCISAQTINGDPTLTSGIGAMMDMFSSCYSITNVDIALPLLRECNDYAALAHMFCGCSGLTACTQICPSSCTFSGINIMQRMFGNCTSLVTAPVLPWTTIQQQQYAYMFMGSTKLQKAPNLPATVLPIKAYYNMFNGCTKLNEIHCSATTFATDATSFWVYGVASSGDFYGYQSAGWTIDSVNGIPSGWTKHWLDRSLTGITMSSSGWDSTKDIPASGGVATSANVKDLKITAHYSDSTSADVTTSATITGSLTIASSSTTTRHSAGTMTLTAEYSGFTTSGNVTVYQAAYIGDYFCFYAESEQTVVFFVQTGGVPSSAGAYGCTPGLSASTDGIHWVKIMERKTTWASLTSYVSSSMTFGTSDAPRLYIKTDGYGLTSLLNKHNHFNFFKDTPVKIEGTSTVLGTNLWEAFYGCTQITTVPKDFLPATTLSDSCYTQTFAGCTNLVQAPDLPATTLATGCYSQMFSGCTSLSSLTCYATDISATYGTYHWLDGITTTGILYVPSSMTSTWRAKIGDASGIPSTWIAVIIPE